MKTFDIVIYVGVALIAGVLIYKFVMDSGKMAQASSAKKRGTCKQCVVVCDESSKCEKRNYVADSAEKTYWKGPNCGWWPVGGKFIGEEPVCGCDVSSSLY